jgi:hypothetical protein
VSDLEPMPQEAAETITQEAPQEIGQEASLPNTYETDARAKGWKPKEEWAGDPEDWTPAKRWLEKGQMLDTIHSLKQQVKSTKESVAYLAEHTKKFEELTAKRRLQESEEKLKQAVEIGDVDIAKAVTQEIVDLHKQHMPNPVTPPSVDPAVQAFYTRNSSWFNEDTAENAAMTLYARRRDEEIWRQNPGITPEDEIRMLERDIQNRFPEKFGRPAPIGAHAVSAPAGTASRPSKVTVDSLPAHHRIVLKKLVHDIKGYDVNKHIQRLKDLGEIK